MTSPVYEDHAVRLYHGEALEVLTSGAFESESFDAINTDPPYSSGGLFKSDRDQSTAEKYCHNAKTLGRPQFTGDNRDGRSYALWSTLWLASAARLLKPSGYVFVFTDWRQLPTMTDVFQAAGLIWRGVIVWNKGNGSRAPHKGYFRHQCEYIVWGTKGRCLKSNPPGPFSGCFHYPVRQADKFHLTGKPTPLLMDLMEPIPPRGLVLDCFAGSGTAGIAARRANRRAVLIEQDRDCVDIATQRLEAT